jgi:hypothetical protein
LAYGPERGLSEKSSLKTLKDVAVNTGIALALKGIYEGGDAGAGLAHMTKFVTSAEATELSIAVAETFSMPALVLAVTELQSDGLSRWSSQQWVHVLFKTLI